MKFIQLHDNLREELLHRIKCGQLSVSLLRRQTRISQPHISNFLHRKRGLSLKAVDRILASQKLEAEDLLPDAQRRGLPTDEERGWVPVVSHRTALIEPVIYPSAITDVMPLPAVALQFIRPHTASHRLAWHRFVAVRVSPADALPMEPLIFPEALAVIDRHYNTLVSYRPNRQSPYAVRKGNRLGIGYLEHSYGRLVLRPHSRAFPVEILEVESGKRPQDLIVGRIVLIQNQT